MTRPAKRKMFPRRCLNDNAIFYPWTDKGRFCSRACAVAFQKTAYAEALARRTTGLSAAVLQGQQRAKAYRASPEFAKLQRDMAGGLAAIQSVVSPDVTS